MFARIAGRYDLLNRVLSAGIDQSWRRRVVKRATELVGPCEGKRVLDACCGTGDLSFAFRKAGAEVLGVDFTREMLDHAQTKGGDEDGSVVFAHGDAMALPAGDDSFDVSTVAFGIRNVADRVKGFQELTRVVRPGGVVLVLEFTRPPGAIFGKAYELYFTRILPVVGKAVSSDDAAYRYLPDTVMQWPSPEVLQQEMEGVGLVDCGFEYYTRGIACLHWGRVPEAGE